MDGAKRTSPRRRGLRGFLGDLAEFAETVGNVVQSAGELLLDTELRKKGATLIAQQADKTINEVQREIEARAEKVQQGARARIGAGAQRLQSVLRNIERQIQDFQRQQQQSDLQAELEHHHKLPVDMQVGDQVYEDMPQEMRTRFWYVLLLKPDLAQGLTRRGIRRISESALFGAATGRAARASSARLSGTPEAAADEDNAAELHHISAEAAAAAVAAAMGDTIEDLSGSQERNPAGIGAAEQSANDTAGVEAAEAAATAGEQSNRPACLGSPFEAYCSSPPPVDATGQPALASADAAAENTNAPAAEAGEITAGAVANTATGAEVGVSEKQQRVNYRSTEDAPDIHDLLGQRSSSAMDILPATDAAADAEGTTAAAVKDGVGTSVERSNSNSSGGAVAAISAACSSSGNCASTVSKPSAPSPWMSVQPASSNASSLNVRPVAPSPWENLSTGHAGSSGSRNGRQDAAAAAVTSPSAVGDGDASWEMVPDDVPADLRHFTEDVETLDSLRSLVQHLSSADSLDASRACQAAVFQAMLNEVPWLAGQGVPPEVDPSGEYARLLQAGCGSVEDIIVRDVPRTFPEHPLFSCHEGQQRLLRVLKAYAAADPEVGYCQGMAFAAGILLMYLPEEPAFRLYHRLMSSGPTLRRLYLPGLDFLKMELSRLELLLSTHTPQLHQHLLDAGLPALLYAAQWLMTCYACPFPVHVAARVLDILLQSDDASILMRLGLAVIMALQDQLLELDDFEALITYMKVKPLSWPIQMHRSVLNDAMNSPASDVELAASTTAVKAEFQRLGRFSSFSSCQLRPLQQLSTSCSGTDAALGDNLASSSTGHGRLRHELVPGPVGPRTAAAMAAAEEAAMASSSSSSSNESSSNSIAAGHQDQPGPQQLQQQQQRQQQQQLAPVAAATAESGVLGELDATLIDLMADMDLALRSESADSEVIGGSTA